MRLQLEATEKAKHLTEVNIYPVTITCCTECKSRNFSNVIASSKHSYMHIGQNWVCITRQSMSKSCTINWSILSFVLYIAV